VAAAIEQKPTRSAAASELEALFRDHHERVLRAAYRITGSMADAEDVAQSVFLRIAQNGVVRKDIDNPGSYLYRAAINAGLDLLRKRGRENAVALDETLPEGHDNGPEKQREAGEQRRWLRAALAGVSPRAAEMFVLRYVEGCDLGEIARMLNTSRAVVAVILHRTRARLQNDLSTYMRGKR
jgi:RNA polymerase sigma-70 factor (ECF subfamily)